MPSEAPVTGRCYCGAVHLTATARPQTVTYCHCSDCRRLTGAAVPAFAAFAEEQLTFTPSKGPRSSATEGVSRWFCRDCGTPLAATFDYLPGQVYVPLGILDQIATLAPESHCHSDSAPAWLHIADDLPRDSASGRDRLQDRACTD